MANQTATVVRFKDDRWNTAWVFVPESDDYFVLKNTVMAKMRETQDRCFQCAAKADSFALTSLRVIHGEDIQRVFVIVDHCPACGIPAAKKASEYRKTELKDEGTFYYRCAGCEKMATKMAKCGRCRITPYCSEACQRENYPLHKIYCPSQKKKKEEEKQ
jgi:hypothetical protein